MNLQFKSISFIQKIHSIQLVMCKVIWQKMLSRKLQDKLPIYDNKNKMKINICGGLAPHSCLCYDHAEMLALTPLLPHKWKINQRLTLQREMRHVEDISSVMRRRTITITHQAIIIFLQTNEIKFIEMQIIVAL